MEATRSPAAPGAPGRMRGSFRTEVLRILKDIREVLERAPLVQAYFRGRIVPVEDGHYISEALLHLLNNTVFTSDVYPQNNVLAYDRINTHFNETFGNETTPDLLRSLSDRANRLADELGKQPYGSTNAEISFIQNAAAYMQNIVYYIDFTPNDTQLQGMMMRRMTDGFCGGDGQCQELRVDPNEALLTQLSLIDERARSTPSGAIDNWYNN